MTSELENQILQELIGLRADLERFNKHLDEAKEEWKRAGRGSLLREAVTVDARNATPEQIRRGADIMASLKEPKTRPSIEWPVGVPITVPLTIDPGPPVGGGGTFGGAGASDSWGDSGSGGSDSGSSGGSDP